MQIDLTRDQILEYAKRYDYKEKEGVKLGAQMKKAEQRGYMTRDDLIAVASWKWRGGRTRQLCEQNTEDEVEEISAASFTAKSERLRIGVLLALRGVHWPMASVILHFAFPDRYPMWDVRTMNTVGLSRTFTFEKWCQYVKLCQDEAREKDISMRTLDKALWQADRETGEGRT